MLRFHPSHSWLAAALFCVGLALPSPATAQLSSDLSPLAEELLKELDRREGVSSPGVAEEGADSGEPDVTDDAPVIPPPPGVVDAPPAIATTAPPPIAGPEAELARRLLAITDTEENQAEIREDLARDFVRRLRGPLLESPDEEVFTEPSESAILLAENQTGIPDGEELIFEVRIDNRRFVQSLFGIKQGNGIFVDLAEAAELLEFAIDVQPESGIAEGFFINPDKTFFLDLNIGQVTIEGETIAVSVDDVLRQEGAILVHSDTFAIWFNVVLSVDFRDLIVNVVPQTPLPLQQRFLRQQRIASLRQAQRADPSLPRLEDPYRAIAVPLADVRVQSSILDVPDQPLRTTQNYSVVGRGDLAFATGDFFFGGNQDDILSAARLTLRREDPTGGLLGPLQATRIEAGDVIAPGLPVGGTGVGAYVTNNTTGIQNLGSTTDFVGNEQPGTDVELYRNGILIDLAAVGDDGRYEFRNVPLILGRNDFRLVFYGTQGEIREERASRTVTSAGERTNLPTYSAAVFRPGDPLLPVEQSAQDRGPVASALQLSRTFGNNISAQGTLSFVDTSRPSTGSLTAAMSMPLLEGVAGLQTTQSFDAGWSATGSFRTRYRGQSIGLQLQTDRNTGGSDSDSLSTDVTGDVPIYGDISLPYSVSVARTVFEDGAVSDSAQLRNSTGLGRYRLSNALEWTRRDLIGSPTTRSLTGTLQNTLLLFPVNLRFGANYRLIEDRELQRVDGDITWTINNRSQARFGYQRFLLSGRKAYSLGGSYRFDRFVLSPTLTYDSNNQFFALLSLSTSVGRDPIGGSVVADASTFSNAGVVAARVYQDTNLNRRLDPGEPLIEDAQIEAVHANRTAATDENGVAYLSRLPPYLLTDVRVRSGTLPDPFMASLEPGRSVLPRPGRTNVIDFPVTLTSEIEGSVDALRGTELSPLPGVTVELRNAQGEVVDSQQTLFDGFFLFVNVFPGEYSVHLLPENVTSEGFVIPPPRRVTIRADGVPLLGVQIVTGPEGVDLPPPADARIAAVRLGEYLTIESAGAALAVYRGLFPDDLGDLKLEMPLAEQAAPYAVTLGRVSRGRAANICQTLSSAKADCSVEIYPYVPDAPLVPQLTAVDATGADQAPTAAQERPVVLLLGRYPDADRAGIAWSLLQRLYARVLDGAVRQPSAARDLVVGVLPESRGIAVCASVIDVVPLCELADAVQPPAPAPVEAPSADATLPTLAPVATVDEGPAVPAAPVAPVAAAPLRPLDAGSDDATGGAEEIAAQEMVPTSETVVAVRLGEYGSQTGVAAGWQLLRLTYPDVLGAARLLESVEPPSAARPLLAGPFSELNALAVCARLIADGQSCRVTRARI